MEELVIILTKATFPCVNGLAEDATVNDWVHEVDGTTITVEDIGDAIVSFYNTVQTNPGTDYAIGQLMAESRSRGANIAQLSHYDITADLAGTPTGSPIETRSWTLVEDTDFVSNLPDEVAIALSFHGDLAGIPETAPDGTRPRARRRGRVFLGPWHAAVIYEPVDGVTRPGPAVRETMQAAATTMVGALDNGWRVWSRANAAVYEVVGGWIDTAFDTVRSRGPASHARNFFPL
jgi:hypothetical protein